METFKVKPGKYRPYEISKENFEKYTRKEENVYAQVGKDGEKRYFAVCPWCDNPIQLIGLYTEIKNGGRPYGKHYCRSVNNVAQHNQQAYSLCPKACHNYSPPEKGDRKEEMTEYEINIYNTAREHFDQIIYLIKKETGLAINQTLARRIIESYYAARGWMYKWATIYNIPWMMLYLFDGFDIYGMLVREGSKLYEGLSLNERYRLDIFEPGEEVDKESTGGHRPKYYRIYTNRWTESNYMASNHRRKTIEGEVLETIDVSLAIKMDKPDDENMWHEIWKDTLTINEIRFPKLITSDKRNVHKNQKLLNIAAEVMPALDSQDHEVE